MEGEIKSDSKKKSCTIAAKKNFALGEQKSKNSDSTAFQYTGIGHTE